MRIYLAAVLLAATLVLSPGAFAEGPNEEQEGSNGLCLDYNTYMKGATSPVTDHLWIVSERSPLAPIVEVEAETWFQASVDGPLTDVSENQGGQLHLNFWDESGEAVGLYSGTHGLVPEQAAYATICVGLLGAQPDADPSNPFATWTYQDGFADATYTT